MVINHLEKLFVTNDTATIMRELEVAHPAAKLLVMASQQQELEVSILIGLVFLHLNSSRLEMKLIGLLLSVQSF